MKDSLVRKILTRFKAIATVLASVTAALSLTGCGGGGGSGSDEVVIAPKSLDLVRISFFGAFTAEFYRGSDSAGTETGGFTYTALRPSFRYSTTNGNSDLGYTIHLPVQLKNTRYTYERTAADTGRITLTFFNNQVYPIPEATAQNPKGPVAQGDMFWGGPDNEAQSLVVDVLFTDTGGYISNVSSRVRSLYHFSSTFADGAATNSVFPEDFDTTEITFRLLTGLPLPAGYDPVFDPSTPSSIVWRTLQGRSVRFLGSDGTLRTIAYQSMGGAGPAIPGQANAEETGTVLVDETDANGPVVQGVGGTYSYVRTGGVNAKFTISYPRTVLNVTEQVTLTYQMSFESLEDGNYVDSTGITGFFDEILEGPN